MIGALNDFSRVPGLANFVGYMLLLAGSKKYSQRNDFKNFAEEHGGIAQLPITGASEQFFSFDVKPFHLAATLERRV